MARNVAFARAASSAAVRLKRALAELTSPTSTPRNTLRLTVAELCRLARISRNSLYRYHPAILQALRDHQRRAPRIAQRRSRDAAARRRSQLLALRASNAKLAALVDHYYGAYRELVVRLECQGRELAELRRRLETRPALIVARTSHR